jgi:hypothetical protein
VCCYLFFLLSHLLQVQATAEYDYDITAASC